MTIKEIKRIAESEMQRDGYLSKGVRHEVVASARGGHQFSLVVSTDDAIRISAELRRTGHVGAMSTMMDETPGRKVVTFNQSK